MATPTENVLDEFKRLMEKDVFITLDNEIIRDRHRFGLWDEIILDNGTEPNINFEITTSKIWKNIQIIGLKKD